MIEAWDAFEQFAGAHEGSGLDVRRRDRALRRGVSATDEVVRGVGDLDGCQRLNAAGPRACREPEAGGQRQCAGEEHPTTMVPPELCSDLFSGGLSFASTHDARL